MNSPPLFFPETLLDTFQRPIGAPKALNKPQRPLKPNSFKSFSFRSITRVKSHTKFQLKILLISKLVFPGLCSLPSVVLPLLPMTIGHSVALSQDREEERGSGSIFCLGLRCGFFFLFFFSQAIYTALNSYGLLLLLHISPFPSLLSRTHFK